jgi:hypothetical protein
VSAVEESAEAFVGGSDEGVIPAILNKDPVPPTPVAVSLEPTELTGSPKLNPEVEGAVAVAPAAADALNENDPNGLLGPLGAASELFAYKKYN